MRWVQILRFDLPPPIAGHKKYVRLTRMIQVRIRRKGTRRDVSFLQNERDETTRQLDSLLDENERLNRNTGELLRMRGEVSLLRRAQETVAKPANSTATAVANGLATAAGSGNEVAVDALVSMSSNTNQNVRRAVVMGLKKAAANQNPTAANALRSMGVQ